MKPKLMAVEEDENCAALDEMAIRNLIARIAQLADSGDADRYALCFTLDARWEMPGAPRCGRADIRAGSRARTESGETGPESGTRHFVGTIAVEVDGDVARATSYFQFLDQTATTPQVRLVGQYDDRFMRSSGGWLLDHRRITLG